MDCKVWDVWLFDRTDGCRWRRIYAGYYSREEVNAAALVELPQGVNIERIMEHEA
jgi:hypothetical protein